MVRAIALLFLLGLAPRASAQEAADFGGRDQFNVGTNAYKLNVYEVDEARILTRFDVWLDAEQGDEVVFVVYQYDGGTSFDLVAQTTVTLEAGDSLKRSPDLDLPLEAGGVYAVGIYLRSDALRYYWGNGNDSATWGSLAGAMWSNNNTTPNVLDPLRDDVSDFGYRQRLVVTTPTDDDDDGYDATVDCDDDNPDVNPGATEVCDGQDTDCDGALGDGESTDTDGDGAPDCSDCDDTDATVYPGADEDPCGLVDMDCDGEVPTGLECDDPDRADKITGSRRCDTGGSGSAAWLLLAGLAAARRSA